MKAIILFILGSLSLAVFGQDIQTAQWETEIYFEDAMGNRDTLTVGHDEQANSEYNPQFGEEAITAPFDSVFEVRAVHYNPNNFERGGEVSDLITTKKIVGILSDPRSSSSCYRFRAPIRLIMKALHYPVTVSWNWRDHNDECNVRNFIRTSFINSTIDQWWRFYEPEQLDSFSACMAHDSLFVIHNTEAFSVGPDYFFALEGSDTLEVLAVRFVDQISDFYSPCSPDIVSASERQDSDAYARVFPNPASDELVLSEDRALSWRLLDAMGREQTYGHSRRIDISGLPPGLYLVQINLGDQWRSYRLVKE